MPTLILQAPIIRSLGVVTVTVDPENGLSTELSQFCHHSLVKLREIGGTQVGSKTVQMIGWQEDLLNFLALAEAPR